MGEKRPAEGQSCDNEKQTGRQIYLVAGGGGGGNVGRVSQPKDEHRRGRCREDRENVAPPVVDDRRRRCRRRCRRRRTEEQEPRPKNSRGCACPRFGRYSRAEENSVEKGDELDVEVEDEGAHRRGDRCHRHGLESVAAEHVDSELSGEGGRGCGGAEGELGGFGEEGGQGGE